MMQQLDNNGNLYAVGWKRYVNRISGVPIEWHTNNPPSSEFIPYLHPYAGLYRLSMYKQLRPFFDHGAPCLNNMVDAEKKGFAVEDFKLEGSVMHWRAGTRRRFGGHWHPNDNQAPSAWNKNSNHPI